MTIPYEPRSYQQRALRIMMQQASLGLFLDPGLGKTSTWLAAFTTLQKLGLAHKMLVIAPLFPMYTTWPREIDKYEEFSHLTWCFLHGEDRLYHLRHTEADVYFVNPEGIQWLCDHCDPSKIADVLCVDESTTFKNSQSKRFKAMRKIFPRFHYRWIGTGTPSPNGIEDLFAQMFILDGGHALTPYITHFRKRWCFPDPEVKFKWHPMPWAFDEITERIAPLTLVMQAEDYIELPDLQTVDLKIQLPPEARRIYKDVEKEFLAELPDTGDVLLAPTTAAAGVKCRQVANGAAFVEEDPRSKQHRWEEIHQEKLNVMDELLEEIGDHPTLITYEFQHDLHRIQRKHLDWPCLTGMGKECLQYTVNEFDAGRITRLLIHSSQAHGLNIQQGCHHMIMFGLSWNWEHYRQLIDRLRRPGQSASIAFIYRILAEQTIEMRVAKRLEEKRIEEDQIKKGATEQRDRIFSGRPGN